MGLIVGTRKFGFEECNDILRSFNVESEDYSWLVPVVEFLQSWFQSDTVELKTSGSTGTPKTILLDKQVLINSALMTNSYFGLNSSTTALLCLPADYIAGKMMLVRAITGKFDLVAVKPQANPFQDLPQLSIDFAAITPYQLLHSFESLKSYPLRVAIVGGGQVNSELEQKVSELPIDFFETFGMTETASHIALRKFNFSKEFTAMGGVSLSVNERSCLVVFAPHLHPKPIVTNDVVELNSTGDSFAWKGRLDRVVNSGGIKLFPELIERKIQQFIGPSYFIDAVGDDALGQKLVLYIEGDEFKQEGLKSLKDNLLQVLTKYEFPQLIRFIPAFVRSESNKILRRQSIETLGV